MVIIVDFDGTVVEHKYPRIGDERPQAIATLKKLQADGHELVLFSVREGPLLAEAVEWCRRRGVVFAGVNARPGQQTDGHGDGHLRKVEGDILIDDHQIGGIPEWPVIYDMICEQARQAE